MNFLRKSLLVILAPLLFLLLYAAALDFGVLTIAGQPTGVKKIIANSGVYQTIVPDALAQAKQASGSGAQIPLDQQVILNAAAQAFTPQVVQRSAETAIDGLYDWLNGKVAEPDFTIDLTPVKANFATAVGKAAEKQAAGLPACPAGVRSDNFDPFSASCLPRGTTPAQVGIQAQNAIMSGSGFLEHPVITANSVKTDTGQSIFSTKLSNLPKQFQRVKKTPYILSALAILSAVGIVFLSSSRVAGLKRAGTIFLSVGIFMLIFAWALNWGVNKEALPKLQFDNAVLQKDVKNLITSLSQSVDKNYWIFGSIYTALGVAAIAGSVVLSRHGAKNGPTKNLPAENTDTPAGAAKTVNEPKKKKSSKFSSLDANVAWHILETVGC